MQHYSDISGLSNGMYLVTWQSKFQDNIKEQASGSCCYDYGIFLQLFNSDGSKQGSEVLVNTEVEGNQQDPSIGVFDNDGCVISWATDGDAQYFNVHAQQFLLDRCGSADCTGPNGDGLCIDGTTPSRPANECCPDFDQCKNPCEAGQTESNGATVSYSIMNNGENEAVDCPN
eukprot:UN25596